MSYAKERYCEWEQDHREQLEKDFIKKCYEDFVDFIHEKSGSEEDLVDEFIDDEKNDEWITFLGNEYVDYEAGRADAVYEYCREQNINP